MSSWRERVSGERIGAAVEAAIATGWVDPDEPATIFHDLDLLRARLAELHGAFPSRSVHTIAIKANPVIEILRFVVEQGCGLEAASYEEVSLALAAGCPPDRVLFDSPAKTDHEISSALEAGIRLNADSFDELDRIIARRPATSTAVVGLRINPLVQAGSIPITSVADPSSRFGERIDRAADELVARAVGRPWLRCLHYHVGSQGAPLDLHVQAASQISAFRRRLNEMIGHEQFDTVDVGGGATTRYTDETAVEPDVFVAAVRAAAPDFFEPPVTLLTEFGRAVQANCGWAVSRVEYVNTSGPRPVAVQHLGADMLMRPAYQPDFWRHEFSTLPDRTGPASPPDWVVSGPLCFAGDVVGRDLALGDVRAGDRIVIHDVGAYTVSMWSHHCSRGIPQILGYEASPDGGFEFRVLRRRDRPADVVQFWSL